MKKTNDYNLPYRRAQTIERRCPSCGKAMKKNLNSCVHCGAKFGPDGRISLRKIHLAVFFIFIIGIGLLYYGYYESNRITPIKQINASMDNKPVRISGVIVDISYDERYEKTTFTINDSTGIIDVFGWSDFSTKLKESNYFPSIGDIGVFEGSVNVYQYTTDQAITTILSVEINSVDSFSIESRPAPRRSINELFLEDEGSQVTIIGDVTDRYISYSGSSIKSISLIINDGTGEIACFISQDLLEITGNNFEIPSKGDTVKVIGLLKLFEGALEIIPANATNSAVINLEV